MNIEEERKAFNEQFGIDDANTFPAFGDGIDSSAVLKCNWLGWVRCAEQKQAEIKSLKSELAKAQAVPEGLVLVPVETLNEALSWANCASSESWSDAQREEIDKHYEVIENAMIEAQEQSND